MVQRRLGRGLDFLLKDSRARGGQEAGVPVDEITANPSQPRKSMDAASLAALKASISTHGLLQPLVVRKEGKGYVLIAGERRWRACRELGIETVPVVVREDTKDLDLELALIENLQRENLTAIEEALAYRELQERYQLTQEKIAERVGKSRPFITNRIRLLELEPEIQDAVSRGTISAGHARALLAIEPGPKRLQSFQRLLGEKVSVREIESRAQEGKSAGTRTKGRPPRPEVRHLEQRLGECLSARVRIQDRGNRGRIVIEYHDLDEFERLCRRLGCDPTDS